MDFDPRRGRASLLLPLKTLAKLTIGDNELRHAVKGEIQIDLAAALQGEPVNAILRRFGLYSFPKRMEKLGELSLSGTSGSGTISPTEDGDRWSLRMEMETNVTYGPREPPEEPPEDVDYGVADVETFVGSLNLQLSLATGTRDHQISGTIELSRKKASIGDLKSIAIEVDKDTPFFFPVAATPQLIVPLKPVAFPLGDDWTGRYWDEQLRVANIIWSKCCIRFEPYGFKRLPKPELTCTNAVTPVLESYDLPGAIEVFWVMSNRAGYTHPAGKSSAGVVISQKKAKTRPNLLAHELGHVLAGCHPDDTCCPSPLWKGERGTILKRGQSPSKNTEKNCNYARRVQPLLQLGDPKCCMKPDD